MKLFFFFQPLRILYAFARVKAGSPPLSFRYLSTWTRVRVARRFLSLVDAEVSSKLGPHFLPKPNLPAAFRLPSKQFPSTPVPRGSAFCVDNDALTRTVSSASSPFFWPRNDEVSPLPDLGHCFFFSSLCAIFFLYRKARTSSILDAPGRFIFLGIFPPAPGLMGYLGPLNFFEITGFLFFFFFFRLSSLEAMLGLIFNPPIPH